MSQAVEMNETLRIIYERRAIRKYTSQMPPRDVIEQILDAGRMAPSAMNRQPWKFYILTQKDQIQLCAKAIRMGAVKGILKSGIKNIAQTIVSALRFPGAADFSKEEDMVFHGAPLVIFITSPRDYEWAGLDIGMCAQNMMLSARSLGLDSCPVGMAKYLAYTDAYPMLGIPKDEQVQLAIILGYGDEHPAMHERLRENAIYL